MVDVQIAFKVNTPVVHNGQSYGVDADIFLTASEAAELLKIQAVRESDAPKPSVVSADVPGGAPVAELQNKLADALQRLQAEKDGRVADAQAALLSRQALQLQLDDANTKLAQATTELARLQMPVVDAATASTQTPAAAPAAAQAATGGQAGGDAPAGTAAASQTAVDASAQGAADAAAQAADASTDASATKASSKSK